MDLGDEADGLAYGRVPNVAKIYLTDELIEVLDGIRTQSLMDPEASARAEFDGRDMGLMLEDIDGEPDENGWAPVEPWNGAWGNSTATVRPLGFVFRGYSKDFNFLLKTSVLDFVDYDGRVRLLRAEAMSLALEEALGFDSGAASKTSLLPSPL
jgi:hypothetical protein